ncbi:MAG: hypothetical protein WD396_03430 [Pseudohongiellaceae bacterium]
MYTRLLLLIVLCGLTAACATHVVKSTTYTPVIQDQQHEPEELLLDVGVAIFDPGLDERGGNDEITNDRVRVAESRYAAKLLANTLQRSGNWGMAYLAPSLNTAFDVTVEGTLLESNGEAMAIRIRVSDATGGEWYTRVYREAISSFSYDLTQRQLHDPFQVLYNIIANDMLAYRRANLTEARIRELRAISQLQFAQRFVPLAFDDYLTQDDNGIDRLARLPAENNPLLVRLEQVRQRDYMFIDTIQGYYDTYVRQMKLPYDSWREQSYHEIVELRELQSSARRRFISGAMVILGGITAATSGNFAVASGGIGGVGAGAYVIKSGLDKRAESQIHLAALEELGDSLAGEVAPNVLSLDEKAITLTGTVGEQFQQWREILTDIYVVEFGGLKDTDNLLFDVD